MLHSKSFPFRFWTAASLETFIQVCMASALTQWVRLWCLALSVDIVRGSCPLALAGSALRFSPPSKYLEAVHTLGFRKRIKESCCTYGMRHLACFPAYFASVMSCFFFPVLLTIFCFSMFGSICFMFGILFVCGPVRVWLHGGTVYIPGALVPRFHPSLSSLLRCPLW